MTDRINSNEALFYKLIEDGELSRDDLRWLEVRIGEHDGEGNDYTIISQADINLFKKIDATVQSGNIRVPKDARQYFDHNFSTVRDVINDNKSDGAVYSLLGAAAVASALAPEPLATKGAAVVLGGIAGAIWTADSVYQILTGNYSFMYDKRGRQ